MAVLILDGQSATAEKSIGKSISTSPMRHSSYVLVHYLHFTHRAQNDGSIRLYKILKEVHHCEYFHHHPIFSFAVLYTFFLLQFKILNLIRIIGILSSNYKVK